MNARVILLVAAGCIVFGIGMGVREMSADIWVRAAVAGASAGLGVVVAGVGHRLWPKVRYKQN